MGPRPRRGRGRGGRRPAASPGTRTHSDRPPCGAVDQVQAGSRRRRPAVRTSAPRLQHVAAPAQHRRRSRAASRRWASTWPGTDEPRSSVAFTRAKRCASGSGARTNPTRRPPQNVLLSEPTTATAPRSACGRRRRRAARDQAVSVRAASSTQGHAGGGHQRGHRPAPARRRAPRPSGCARPAAGRRAPARRAPRAARRGRRRRTPWRSTGTPTSAGAGLAERGQRARVGRVLAHDSVARSHPAGGRGGDGLLGAGRDHHLLGGRGQTPHRVTWSATAARSSDQPPRGVARGRADGPQVGRGERRRSRWLGVVRDRQGQVDQAAVPGPATGLGQVVDEGRALPVGRQRPADRSAGVPPGADRVLAGAGRVGHVRCRCRGGARRGRRRPAARRRPAPCPGSRPGAGPGARSEGRRAPAASVPRSMAPARARASWR